MKAIYKMQEFNKVLSVTTIVSGSSVNTGIQDEYLGIFLFGISLITNFSQLKNIHSQKEQSMKLSHIKTDKA